MAEYIVRETGYPGAVKQEIVGELVRCKDCKHSVKHQLGYGCGMNYHLATNGEWFCADGERREDE